MTPHDAAHDGAGARPLPGGAVATTDDGGSAAAVRRRVRDLRPRQRRGHRRALYAYRDALPTFRAHNEQAMAHAAIAYAKAQHAPPDDGVHDVDRARARPTS